MIQQVNCIYVKFPEMFIAKATASVRRLCSRLTELDPEQDWPTAMCLWVCMGLCVSVREWDEPPVQ